MVVTADPAIGLPEDMLVESTTVASAPAFEPVETFPGASEMNKLAELLARVRALTRRNQTEPHPLLRHERLELDPSAKRAVYAEQVLDLTRIEYAVLEELMVRPGAVLSRAQLEDRLYGWGDAIESNAVSVYIHQLRRKLGSDFIRNVRGVGYYVGRPEADR